MVICCVMIEGESSTRELAFEFEPRVEDEVRLTDAGALHYVSRIVHHPRGPYDNDTPSALFFVSQLGDQDAEGT